MGAFTSAVHADEMRSRRAPGPGTKKDAQVATVDDVIAVEVECGVVAAPCRKHGTQVCTIDSATAVVVAHAAIGAVVRKAVSIGIRTTVAEAVVVVVSVSSSCNVLVRYTNFVLSPLISEHLSHLPSIKWGSTAGQ